jgi:hypothetical protein
MCIPSRVVHQRQPQIKAVRHLFPYVDFDTPPPTLSFDTFKLVTSEKQKQTDDPSTCEPTAATTAALDRNTTRRANTMWTHLAPAPSYGSRHIHDTAPFSLWVEDSHDFRYPTKDELAYIQKTYNAAAIMVAFPVLVIETDTPPKPVPLTVGCTLTHFVEVGSKVNPRPIWHNTAYSNPCLKDPLGEVRLPKFVSPSLDQMILVVEALEPLCKVKAINFISPHLVVELQVDGSSYGRHSLPGIVGGVPTLYHHSEENYWKTQVPLANERIITPNLDLGIQDYTSYLHQSDARLCPGVRLSSGPLTDIGEYAEASLGTTSGVLLRKGAMERLTAAEHGFPTTEVYHPNVDGTLIGEVKDRNKTLDLALIQLYSSFRYTNSGYFDAVSPKRLLKHSQVGNEWCSLDGMTTGLVFLLRQYDRLFMCTENDPEGTLRIIWCAEFIFESVGPTAGGAVVDGICGAPIVTDEGGVAGFFHQADNNGRWCVCAALDPIIDEGWELV